MIFRFLILLLAGLSFSHFAWAGTLSQIGASRWVTVKYVYDGDTFKTTSNEKIRLLSINTPEIAHGDSPGQPLGNAAKKKLRSLILGKPVQLEFDKDKRDKYGRTLAHVYLRDHTWVNARMIEESMAHAYIFTPNFRHAKEILNRERLARIRKHGIWKTSRFRVLQAGKVTRKYVGQFRIVSGRIAQIKHNKWSFKTGKLWVSIPKKYRQWFKTPLKIKSGDLIAVHGKIRLSGKNRLYLALHSPFDLEILKR